jgi:aspartyl-tRNA(Asn)/glutamyl-tRNA(Gln) amidotransferase subunit A
VIPLRPSLDHVGTLTRSVAGSALLLQPLAGYDPDDITSADVPVPNYAEALGSRKVRVRLGVPRRLFYDQLDPDIEKVVHQALAVLGQFAQSTQDVELPELTMLPVAPTGAEVYAYHAQYMVRSPELYQEETLLRLRGTAEVSAAAYIDAMRSIERLRRAVKKVFATVDVLVTPTMAIPPATIADAGRVELEMIQKKQLSPLIRNTVPFDVYGLPTISVPCGFTSAGLPIGLQLSGPPWAEVLALRLARAYEQATTKERRPPTW